MSTETIETLPEPVEGAETAQDGPVAPVEATTGDPDTFPAEYVRRLRAEAAEARVKAKIADTANEHLLAAYAANDGRLVDVEALALDDTLIGDDGLVDRAKVSERIGELIAAKPHLASRKPTTPLPMGVQPEAPAEVGWLSVLRGEVR